MDKINKSDVQCDPIFFRDMEIRCCFCDRNITKESFEVRQGFCLCKEHGRDYDFGVPEVILKIEGYSQRYKDYKEMDEEFDENLY